jgi:hypothetical protein
MTGRKVTSWSADLKPPRVIDGDNVIQSIA